MSDAQYMQLALAQARMALAAGEVPVGAVLVNDGAVIAVGRNAPIGQNDPSAHAEMAALRAGALALGNYRLDECELFVTLEPCAMCAGAVLHSRLRRLVFGATDPKTGAAGSVLNLFAQTQINHQTTVQGGVLAAECAALLQGFFRAQREQHRATAEPIPQDALRTPDASFAALKDWPWSSRYVHELPGLGGLRLHYVDEGPLDAAQTDVFVHGRAEWCYQWRAQMQSSRDAARRVLALDLPGFGRSDKPKKPAWHSAERQRRVLQDWLQFVAAQDVNLCLPTHDDFLALTCHATTWPQVRQLTWMSPEPMPPGAKEAPFPNAGYGAARRAFAAAPSTG